MTLLSIEASQPNTGAVIIGNFQTIFGQPTAPKVTWHPVQLFDGGNSTTISGDRVMNPGTTNTNGLYPYFYSTNGSFGVTNVTCGLYNLIPSGASRFIQVFVPGTTNVFQINPLIIPNPVNRISISNVLTFPTLDAGTNIDIETNFDIYGNSDSYLISSTAVGGGGANVGAATNIFTVTNVVGSSTNVAVSLVQFPAFDAANLFDLPLTALQTGGASVGWTMVIGPGGVVTWTNSIPSYGNNFLLYGSTTNYGDLKFTNLSTTAGTVISTNAHVTFIDEQGDIWFTRTNGVFGIIMTNGNYVTFTNGSMYMSGSLTQTGTGANSFNNNAWYDNGLGTLNALAYKLTGDSGKFSIAGNGTAMQFYNNDTVKFQFGANSGSAVNGDIYTGTINLSQVANGSILQTSSSSGNTIALTIGSGLSFNGTTLSATGIANPHYATNTPPTLSLDLGANSAVTIPSGSIGFFGAGACDACGVISITNGSGTGTNSGGQPYIYCTNTFYTPYTSPPTIALSANTNGTTGADWGGLRWPVFSPLVISAVSSTTNFILVLNQSASASTMVGSHWYTINYAVIGQ